MNTCSAGLTSGAGRDQLIAHVRDLTRHRERQRTLLGITGPPGAGKSTLASMLVADFGVDAQIVGMDGFHLSQARLAELGRLDRKGAIDTFDGPGFLSLIQRLRNATTDIIYAPEFRREIEESISGVVEIGPNVQLVVVEGNYLLVPSDPWGNLRELFDEVWYCEPSESTRIAGLTARHRAYGRSEDEARRWALGPDQRNAELIATTRHSADMIVTLDYEVSSSEESATHAEQRNRTDL